MVKQTVQSPGSKARGPLVGNLLHSLGIHVIADATPQGTIHVADKARGEAKTYNSSPGVPYSLIRPIRQLRRSRACGGGWDVKNPLNTR